jgi:hypothetical protein
MGELGGGGEGIVRDARQTETWKGQGGNILYNGGQEMILER